MWSFFEAQTFPALKFKIKKVNYTPKLKFIDIGSQKKPVLIMILRKESYLKPLIIISESTIFF